MQHEHFLAEDPRKCPFEVKKSSKEWRQGEPLMEKPELPNDQGILHPWLLP
jgi:hypothetical protein